jgi:hypothetical protein
MTKGRLAALIDSNGRAGKLQISPLRSRGMTILLLTRSFFSLLAVDKSAGGITKDGLAFSLQCSDWELSSS